MPLDAGDVKYQPGQGITLDKGDNTVEGGDAVTFDEEGNITRATDGDFVVGTVLPVTVGNKAAADPDSKETVWTAGLGVVVETDAAVDPGDHLEGAAAGDGTYQAAVDPGTDTSLPFVVHAEDESENLYVAIFR